MPHRHPITGEFRDAATERSFRAAALGAMQRDSRLALFVAAGIIALFAISDYNFVGFSETLYTLFAVRAVMISACLVMAVVLHRSEALLTRPWLYSAAPVLIASGMFLLMALRPHTLPTQLTAAVVVIMAFYLFIPNLLWGMIGSSVYLTVGLLLAAWYWAGASLTGAITYGVLLAVANIVGYMVALRLAVLQREQFALLNEERFAKQRLVDEMSRREAVEKRLRTMAQTDELTGLSNRRHLMESAQEALLAARRLDRPFSVCMIDVDNFKAINDVWGHACGDTVLREVARTCREALRDGEPIGRIGGEEFVAALPGADTQDALHIAERLRGKIADLRFGGTMAELRVTVTIGLSEVQPREGEIEPALKRADTALYKGKRSGRNAVLVHSAAGRRADMEPASAPISYSAAE